MNQKKSQNHNSKKKNRISKKELTPKQDGEVPKKREPIKVSLLSTENESIKSRFLQENGASKRFSKSFKKTLGVELFTSSSSAGRDYSIQFWLIGNESSFESLYPTYLKSSWGVIYFYGITDAIKNKQLALIKSSIKSSIDSKMHLLFVGYDAVLPAHPEEIDQNIPLIQKYFPDCRSIYIAEGQPDAMIHVLDELIRLDTA